METLVIRGARPSEMILRERLRAAWNVLRGRDGLCFGCRDSDARPYQTGAAWEMPWIRAHRRGWRMGVRGQEVQIKAAKPAKRKGC